MYTPGPTNVLKTPSKKFKLSFKFFFSLHGNGDTIRIGWGIQCLLFSDLPRPSRSKGLLYWTLKLIAILVKNQKKQVKIFKEGLTASYLLAMLIVLCEVNSKIFKIFNKFSIRIIHLAFVKQLQGAFYI